MVRQVKRNKEQQVELKLIPDESVASARIYSNFAQVSHGPYDFTIRFCDVTPLHDEIVEKVKKTGEHHIPIVAEIAVPVSMMQPLIDALSAQLKKYRENYEGGPNAEQAEDQSSPDILIQ